jgi:hypothetical protein
MVRNREIVSSVAVEYFKKTLNMEYLNYINSADCKKDLDLQNLLYETVVSNGDFQAMRLYLINNNTMRKIFYNSNDFYSLEWFYRSFLYGESKTNIIDFILELLNMNDVRGLQLLPLLKKEDIKETDIISDFIIQYCISNGITNIDAFSEKFNERISLIKLLPPLAIQKINSAITPKTASIINFLYNKYLKASGYYRIVLNDGS